MNKKVKKDFWEQLFVYPSFNTRFGFTFFLVLTFFSVVTYLVIFKLRLVDNISDQIAMLNLIAQISTLVLGVFAAYYALRQLVETRFNSLDEAGLQELKLKHYSRAFDKWKEAFYIRPEAKVFTNLCESLILIGDYEAFDQYVRISENRSFLKKDIFQENSDIIILLYLKSVRHLLVKNQGEAEKSISELIDFIGANKALGSFQWNFIDMQTSNSYLNLEGECKIIAENLISYLSKNMPEDRRVLFEAKKFNSPV